MKRREVAPSDRAALLAAACAERTARERWDVSVATLQQAIRTASQNGASLREIANTISRSHARVRQLLERELDLSGAGSTRPACANHDV